MDAINIQEITGLSLDAVVLILALAVIVLLILLIVNMVKNANMRKAYDAFMMGNDGENLENTLIKRLEQIDDMLVDEAIIKEKLTNVTNHLDNTFQKVGVVKYDAFDEMGGRLSFSVALLNRKNTGFVLNAMHSREGCFTYIKDIINGNPVTLLSDEEAEAVDIALGKVTSKDKE